MPIEDYIPNVFGQAPVGYEGLLGADRTQALQKTANLQGLLGAASALAQGMSGQGSRRSALQNILGAVSGGFQGSQGAYQQGLQQFSQQQAIEQAQLAKTQAALLRADVEKVMQMPEVANNPALVASLRADPAKALAFINENLPVSQAYQTAPQPAPQPAGIPSGIPSLNAADGQILSPVPVTARVSPLQAQKDRLLSANQRLTGVPGKTAQDAIKNNIDQIASLDKQLMQESVSNFDFNSIKSTVAADLVPQVNNLQRLAETGQISASELQSNLKDIQTADFNYKKDQRDYNKEAVRVAGSMFPNTPMAALNPEQLGQLQTKLDQLEIAKRKAGASTVSVNTGKAFNTEFGKGVAESVANTYAAAQSAQSTLSAIQNIRPLIQSGVYAGPLSSVPRVIEQLATSLGVTGKDNNEKLKNTAIAMQGLASLELSAAGAMKGQGSVTENERSLIKRAAAGDLQSFTQPEVLALLNAIEKTSQFKIKAHDKNLVRLKNRPDTADLADFYSLEQQAPAAATSSVRKYNPATGRIE